MQLIAIIRDTWRLLRARKLFWFSLWITALAGLLFASISFDSTGWSVLYGLKHFADDNFRSGSPAAGELYGLAFTGIVNWWLTFFGIILALVSTASIFPEMLQSGAIDVVLSKPISRTGLFIAKYLSALLFVAFQVTLLSVMVFGAGWWRLGVLDWSVFLSIPLVVLFFSYLYSVAVLLGVWLKSSLPALLLTLLFWGLCSGLAWVERVTIQSTVASNMGELSPELKPTVETTRRYAERALIALPKTYETADLARRWIIRDREISWADLPPRARATSPGELARDHERARRLRDAALAMEKSPAYILGTSLAFELLILTWACWLFSRRDY